MKILLLAAALALMVSSAEARRGRKAKILDKFVGKHHVLPEAEEDVNSKAGLKDGRKGRKTWPCL